MRAWLRLAFSSIPLIMALGCEVPLLQRSCAGERVALCVPYEHSVVTSASIEPAELPVADFSMDARVRIELERCPDAPAPHVVELLAVVPDGEPGEVRVTSLVTLRDGEDGDPVDGDGIIDVTITNPLLVTVPPESDITLRFSPRSLRRDTSDPLDIGCTGESFDVPYRTGPFREMM